MTLGTGNLKQFRQAISHLLFKVTHTPPKTTGVVTPIGLPEMPISTRSY